MRIAWFTPFASCSAIGRCSRLVTDELAKHADVDIWHPVAAETHATSLRTVAYANVDQIGPALSSYDLAVYNMGDHLPFHREIWLASQMVPGIAILHDFVMHHFFAGYYLHDLKSPEEYLKAMIRLYGERGRVVTERSFAGAAPWVWETDGVMEFPFFEEAIRHAYAVIVHSDFFRDQVRTCHQGPLSKLCLPYDTSSGRAVSRTELQVPEDHVLIVTVGHVNPNKRILSFIEAMGRNKDLCGKVTYAVLGPCEGAHAEELREAVRRNGLGNAVRFLGYISNEQLYSFLTHADMCVNLRYPAMEGASASAIEEMLYGKVVIVTDTGFYRELPDDCVRKIPPETELEDLTAALRYLLTDAPARKRMGSKAKSFARKHFRADRYVAGFMELATEVLEAKPLLEYADRITRRLAQMNVTPDMAIVDTVSEVSHELFCREANRPR